MPTAGTPRGPCTPRATAIRHAVTAFFAGETAVWNLKAQLCADAEAMPVEGVQAWDETASPFLPVARIIAEPQPAWTERRAMAVDDGMRFSPWNGVADHRPLGAIMRLRQLAYDSSAAFRSQRNERPVTEPPASAFGHAGRSPRPHAPSGP